MEKKRIRVNPTKILEILYDFPAGALRCSGFFLVFFGKITGFPEKNPKKHLTFFQEKCDEKKEFTSRL